MIYAPILVPTLCRYEHFKNCIESLQSNSWAKYTEIYIALDYPAKESHWDGYRKIEAFLDAGIKGFADVHVIKREKNYGVIGKESNISCLIDDVRKRYDRIICSEDDNVFAPCFIEYIDKMLQASEDDDSVMAVCGYSYPVKWEDDGLGVIKEQSFFSAWGYGCFINRESWMINYYDEKYQRETIKKRRFIKLWKKSKKNFCYFAGLAWHKNVMKHDIARSCLMTLENKFCIMPSISLVRNCGWDGSGLNCNVENDGIDYSNQLINENQYFDFRLATTKDLKHQEVNERLVNNLYMPRWFEIVKSWVKYLLIFFAK